MKELEKKGETLAGTGRYKGPYALSDEFFEELREIDKKVKRSLSKIGHALVLATTPDEKVSLANATTIINLVKEPKEIHIFEHTNHAYAGVEKEAVELVRNWFKKHLYR